MVRGLPRRLAFPVVALFAAACTDAPYEPAALLLTPEVEAAIDVAVELPTLPRLVDRAIVGAADPAVAQRLVRARALWQAAEQEGDEARAASLRGNAYSAAGAPLAATLAPGELAAARSALEHWLTTAHAVPGATSIPELARSLTLGGRLLDEAATYAAADRDDEAVARLLAAADALAATTPRGLAVRLLAVAQTRMEQPAVAGVTTETDRRRADRLLRGAREALAEGDYPLAIRRAYYAGQLLRAR